MIRGGQPRTRPAARLAAAALVVLAAACERKASASRASAEASAAAAAKVQTEATDAAGGYALVLRGPPPPADPRRIVTVAPSLTEILFAIGAGERVVGVTRYDDHPPEVAGLPRVGGFLDPSPEAVAALRPDLILCQPSPGNRAPLEALAAQGIPLVGVPLHSMEDLDRSIREVGRLVGRAAEAAALAERLLRERAAVRALTQGLRRPRVLFLHGRAPLVAAGRGSYTDALITEAGGQNIAKDSKVPYPVLSAEWIVAQAPEVVLLVPEARAGEARPEGPVVPGLRGARVEWLDAEPLLRPGPRLGEGLRRLARAIHPELLHDP